MMYVDDNDDVDDVNEVILTFSLVNCVCSFSKPSLVVQLVVLVHPGCLLSAVRFRPHVSNDPKVLT